MMPSAPRVRASRSSTLSRSSTKCRGTQGCQRESGSTRVRWWLVKAPGRKPMYLVAPNIAARVQVAADPGTVAITASTHRLVSGLFVVEDRGKQELKGLERPLQ